MEEKGFFEAEALETAVQAAAERIGAQVDAETLLASCPEEAADRINDILVELLKGLPSELITVREHETPPAGLHGYGMRAHAATDAGLPARMIFFRVRQAAPTMAIYLLGLAVVFTVLPLATAVAPAAIPTLMVLKTAWENIVKLEGAADSAAMRCYEALLRWQSAHPDGPSHATVAELQPLTAIGEEEPLAIERLKQGLSHLRDQKLVSVEKWGSDAGRVEDIGNRWTIAI
jgi:hypothetical protein